MPKTGAGKKSTASKNPRKSRKGQATAADMDPPPDVGTYPKDVEVDHEKRAVNLAWYAKQIKEGTKPADRSEFLDYELAVYLVAKLFPTLRGRRDLWRKLFDFPVEDPEILRFFELMRLEYLKYIPNKPNAPDNRNWSNQVLDYLKKVVSRSTSKSNNLGVMQLLVLKLMGRMELSLDRTEAIALLGGSINILKVNAVFSGVEEAKYELIIPEDLKDLYDGKGYSYDELKWISDSEMFLKAAEQETVPLEESDDQKSSVFWHQKLDRLRKKKEALEEGLKARRQQVAETERDVAKVIEEIAHDEQMLHLAIKKEEFFAIDGGPQQKLALMNNVKLMWNVLKDKEMSMEDLLDTVMHLRESIQDSEPAGPPSSKKRKRESSPDNHDTKRDKEANPDATTENDNIVRPQPDASTIVTVVEDDVQSKSPRKVNDESTTVVSTVIKPTHKTHIGADLESGNQDKKDAELETVDVDKDANGKKDKKQDGEKKDEEQDGEKKDGEQGGEKKDGEQGGEKKDGEQDGEKKDGKKNDDGRENGGNHVQKDGVKNGGKDGK